MDHRREDRTPPTSNGDGSEYKTTIIQVQEGLCVLGACCLVCQDPVSCNFHFVLLPLGSELW